MNASKGDRELDKVIGLIMRYGVVISFIIIAIGSVLFFVEGQTGYSRIGNAEQLVVMRNLALIGLYPLFQGVISAKPYAIIDLGALILLATPFIRVAASAFLFFHESRYLFVWISIAVLAILLAALLIVAPFVSTG